MVLAWTATIFRLFFDYFLSICLGESANRPEIIFSLFFDYPLEPPRKLSLSFLYCSNLSVFGSQGGHKQHNSGLFCNLR